MLTKFKATLYGYTLIYSFHQSFNIYIYISMIIFLYPLFKLVCSLNKKIKGYQAFHIFHLLFSCRASQVKSDSSEQTRAYPKAWHTGLHNISHLMDGNSSNPWYLQGSISSNWATHQLSLSILPYRLHQLGGGN